jgi:uncharacterized protein (TIGR03546 family)
MLFNPIFKLFSILNGDDNPSQIAWGVVLGCVIGLSPFYSLHNLILFFIVCVMRVHFSSFVISAVVFSAIAALIDPISHQVGEALLTNPSLLTVWANLYDIDIFRLARFNHTITLGALTVALAAALPLFFLTKILVNKYREKIRTRLEKLKFVQILKASKLGLMLAPLLK